MKGKSHNVARPRSSKPYEVVGAGQLTATVWKTGEATGGWRYRFNMFRQNSETGAVGQLYRPADLPNFIKLCHVLALTLSDDGCLSASERRLLINLASRLSDIFPTEED